MAAFPLQETVIQSADSLHKPFSYLPADTFPTINPVHWLVSHFAVGGWSPLQRISGMLTAHMTQIAPQNGFTWHPHRALEIYTWVLEGELYHEDTTGGKGIIRAGELQRMFAGDYIEHQELNRTDDYARVIQIWYIADRHHRGKLPHYQQVGRGDLPKRHHGDATVYSLIGDNSPMEQHMTGRLTAATISAAGTTTVEAPEAGEDLFLYVTDGSGTVTYEGAEHALEQYDVILARPDMAVAAIASDQDGPLNFLSFYLPSFLN